MSGPRGVDPRIGYRAAECVRAKWGTPAEFRRATGIRRQLVHEWATGANVPSAQYLQIMCKAGIDVVYILTGRLQDE